MPDQHQPLFVEYLEDQTAPPGDLVGALAALVLDRARAARRLQAQAEAAPQRPQTETTGNGGGKNVTAPATTPRR